MAFAVVIFGLALALMAKATDDDQTIVLKKCCQPDHYLVASSLECKRISEEAERFSAAKSFLPRKVFNSTFVRDKDEDPKFYDPTLTPNPWKEGDLLVGTPSGCGTGRGAFKLLDMTNPFLYLVTTDGELMSLGGDYEIGFRLGEFCLDLAKEGDEYNPVAMVCDPCSHQDRVCISTCCHHLQIGSRDALGQFYCRNIVPLTFSPPRWTPNFTGTTPKDYVLMYKSIEGCEVNRNNQDGLVLEMQGQVSLS